MSRHTDPFSYLNDWDNWGRDDMGRWMYLGEAAGAYAVDPPSVDATPPAPLGPDLEPPYDDSKDHDPCPDCNRDGKGMTPGWYTPFVGPPIYCETCDGAGWV